MLLSFIITGFHNHTQLNFASCSAFALASFNAFCLASASHLVGSLITKAVLSIFTPTSAT
jgi:hypothetical protein